VGVRYPGDPAGAARCLTEQTQRRPPAGTRSATGFDGHERRQNHADLPPMLAVVAQAGVNGLLVAECGGQPALQDNNAVRILVCITTAVSTTVPCCAAAISELPEDEPEHY
jgi:hypothetical protein